MKKTKKILSVLLAALTLSAALFGCGSKDQETNKDSAGSDKPAASDTRVEPIASAFDPTNLENCVFSVSFANDDIELNDEGTLVLHMTVWEQELFDATAVTTLKEGDTIVVRGQAITVASLERADNIVRVNGGSKNGGVSLAPTESGGTFCESSESDSEDSTRYTSVAQLTLPVNADGFVYTDSSDPEKGEVTYLAGDLLTQKNTVDFSCTAANGTAHIVDNQVLEITRAYMP